LASRCVLPLDPSAIASTAPSFAESLEQDATVPVPMTERMRDAARSRFMRSLLLCGIRARIGAWIGLRRTRGIARIGGDGPVLHDRRLELHPDRDGVAGCVRFVASVRVRFDE